MSIRKYINHEKFLDWLSDEGEEICLDYHLSVQSMCEYGCLYFGMLTYDDPVIDSLKIYYGHFKVDIFTPEHYWVGYVKDDKEYFIDFTVAQFDKGMPYVLVIDKEQAKAVGYSWVSEGTPLKEYIDQVEGFKFYTNPVTNEPAPCKIPEDYLEVPTYEHLLEDWKGIKL